jgi:hypothetical protein
VKVRAVEVAEKLSVDVPIRSWPPMLEINQCFWSALADISERARVAGELDAIWRAHLGELVPTPNQLLVESKKRLAVSSTVVPLVG